MTNELPTAASPQVADDAEHAAWLADKIVALGDYAKEAAEMLRRWPLAAVPAAAQPTDELRRIAERVSFEAGDGESMLHLPAALRRAIYQLRHTLASLQSSAAVPLTDRTELTDQRIKEIAEEQGSWGVCFGYTVESEFTKPAIPKHAYTFARAIERECRGAAPGTAPSEPPPGIGSATEEEQDAKR